MIKLLFLVAFVLTGITTTDQNPINGEWKGSRETPNGLFEVNYTFKVEGNVLTGTSKSQFGEVKLENGKVEGKKISYTITVNDMTINNTGQLINDDEILITNDWGDLTLKRVK
jgi:hypothetical protein